MLATVSACVRMLFALQRQCQFCGMWGFEPSKHKQI